MAGRKKKASPKGHPRLKPCQQCQVLNPPRTFFCKECNHPFYSEEYMANRLDRKRSEPFTDESESVPPTPSVVKPNMLAVHEFVDRIKMIPELSSCYKLETEKLQPDSPLDFELIVGTESSNLSLSNHHEIDPALENSLIIKKTSFIYTGGRVGSVAFNPSSQYLVILVNYEKIFCWDIANQKMVGVITSDEFIKSVTFCSNFASDHIIGILAINKTDKIELILLERGTQNNLSFRFIFSTTNVFEDPLFPTGVDCRFLDDSIELIISNNLSSFVYYVRLNDSLTPLSFRAFGYNHVMNKLNLNDPSASSSSSVQSTCVCFMRTNANFFLAGYSVGIIGLWDIRNPTIPVQLVINSAGTRRYLLGVKTSWINSSVGFAAFQGGSLLDLDPSDQDVEVATIGGEVKEGQCFGVDSVNTRVYVGMSTGVMLTLNTALRGKIRRALTSYVSQWEAEIGEESESVTDNSGDCLEEKLIAQIRENQGMNLGRRVYCKIFPAPKIPNNLKFLKPSDGALNEGFPRLRDNTKPIAITCVESSADGLVACGNEAGIVHIFRSE